MSNQQNTPRKPTHDVCHVKGEGQKAYWTKIGAAWLHEDGKGLNVSLDFVPTGGDGRLVIRLRKEKSEQGEAA